MSLLPANPPKPPVPHQAQALQIPRPTATPWLALAGAKGGVGKTTLAVNLAVLLAAPATACCWSTSIPGCGNVAVHLRLQGRFDLDDVAAGTCSARRRAARRAGRHPRAARAFGPDAAARRRSRAAEPCARRTHRRGQLVRRGGDRHRRRLGQATLAVTERADLVLAVTTPDAAAVTDTYALCKVLHLRGRPLPQLVANRVQTREEAMRTAAKLAGVTRKFLGKDLTLCGFVARDAKVEHAVLAQEPVALFGTGPGLDDLQSLAAAALAALPPVRRTQPAPVALPRPVRLRPAAT
jgi:flagellar biosynthesis protein FlhG